MARTMFVNPSRRRRGRKAKRRGVRRAHKRRSYRPAGRLYTRNPRRYHRRAHRRAYRRNAGIAPFVRNPLIMQNPRRRRQRHRNPLARLTTHSIVNQSLTYAGGAAVAVATNALFLNSVSNAWLRNGLRLGGAVLGAAALKGHLGAATAGAMLYPMMQEIAAMLLAPAPKKTVATEADMERLAADLEDVMGDLDESDLSDDGDALEVSDDLDEILS